MTEYEYSREIKNYCYDINNPLRLDAGEPLLLYMEIQNEATLPTEFTIKCNGTVCIIEFASALTAPQKTLLDTVVSNHENNT